MRRLLLFSSKFQGIQNHIEIESNYPALFEGRGNICRVKAASLALTSIGRKLAPRIPVPIPNRVISLIAICPPQRPENPHI